jgi:hypothetical protein
MLEQPMNLEIPKCEKAQVRSISREADLAWLAGILDGEGALSVALNMRDKKRLYLDAKVRVYNTDVRMIQKIARIYTELNVVFFYNLNKKRKAHYKNQLGICIGSQGSCLKILEAVKLYLANKQEIAQAMIDVIIFVKSLPRAGATWSNDYAEKDAFKQLMEKCISAKVFHIDPSTTKRKAGEVIAW